MTPSKPPRLKLNGWVNLDKPLHLTSADAVHKAKYLIRPEKIGHAGTLDPLATGILPLALGEATKCIQLLMDAKKTYAFHVTFGERRSTDDAEGEVVATSEKIPTLPEIQGILPQFMGTIPQMPPAYSALKIAGKRAYDLARAGEEVVLAARDIQVHTLTCTHMEGVTAHFIAQVGKGTYIRALGRDIAQTLGSEGYISSLRRTAVGGFLESRAISLDFLQEIAHKAAEPEARALWFTPLEAVLDGIPAQALSASEWQKFRQGMRIPCPRMMPPETPIAIMHREILVGLAVWQAGELQPKRLLHTQP
jgi:tRNA pseudouridine55 synthase